MYGMSNPRKAWRRCPLALSACLRSVHEGTFFYYQLTDELSPRTGGPAG